MEQANFYVFRNNSSYKDIYTWAISIIPESEMIEEGCDECESYSEYPSGSFGVVCEGGSQYPDILGCGAYPFLIVSESVIFAWSTASKFEYHAFPVTVREVRSRSLHIKDAPKYFRIEIDGRCNIDLEASGFEIVTPCPACGIAPKMRKGLDYTFFMTPNSWDGSSMFRDISLFPLVSFCTESLVDLAQRYKLTNFHFAPMQKQNPPSYKGIDYAKGER